MSTSPDSVTERDAMVRALELARGGWGRVAPNPLVGAVLLKDGRIIGEGFHAEFGGPHAEVRALTACADPNGSTCIVNLEPCSHVGKTPPCAEALIHAGVRRVVYSIPDPDAKARGGAERLRAAGVEVQGGVMAREATWLNAPFLCAEARPERPFVALKVATSLDGFLADANGRSQWISSPDARAFVQWLRAGYDGIGVGRATAEADDPQLTARELIPRIPPTRFVFSRTGQVPERLRVVQTATAIPTMVVTTLEGRERAQAQLANTGVRFLAAPDLESALQGIRAAGVRALLIEGGGALAGEFLEAGFVDRLYWVQAPLWLGQGVGAFGRRSPLALTAAARWTVVERQALGVDTLLVVDRAPCLPVS